MIGKTDTDPKIQEIENRLDKATEGEWNLEGKEIWRRGDGYGGEYSEGHVWITDFNGSNVDNAILIANAPTDIAYLLSEVERLTRYLERISVTFGEFECQRLAKEALSHLKG